MTSCLVTVEGVVIYLPGVHTKHHTVLSSFTNGQKVCVLSTGDPPLRSGLVIPAHSQNKFLVVIAILEQILALVSQSVSKSNLSIS